MVSAVLCNYRLPTATSKMSQYETALNIVLGTTLCFLVYKLATSKKAAPLKPYVAKKVVLTEFTPTMLQLHNGVGDALTYLAVKGNVYNVSAGAAFYGPGYSNSLSNAVRGICRQRRFPRPCQKLF